MAAVKPIRPDIRARVIGLLNQAEERLSRAEYADALETIGRVKKALSTPPPASLSRGDHEDLQGACCTLLVGTAKHQRRAERQGDGDSYRAMSELAHEVDVVGRTLFAMAGRSK